MTRENRINSELKLKEWPHVDGEGQMMGAIIVSPVENDFGMRC
jgi:hypothetical protein